MIDFDMQLVINICTLITSLISLLTLREMVKQRRSSMIPTILPKSQYNLNMLLNEKSTSSCLYIWTNDDEHFENSEFSYDIELSNIGIGTAIDIYYEWKLDIDCFIEKIDSLQKEQKKYSFSKLKSSDEMILRTSSSLAFADSLKSDNNKISFIQTSQNIKISLPTQFVLLFSALIDLHFDNDINQQLNMEDIVKNYKNYPYPTLVLKYKDIAKHEYKKTFDFRFEPKYISQNKCSFLLKVIEK